MVPMAGMASVSSPRLAAALLRLEVLVDWERRDRSAGALQSMRVDTEAARALCRAAGAWPCAPASGPEPLVVHVAGSKGKGSVTALVDAALVAQGISTARYSSPHVERITERVALDGREVDEETLAGALEAVLDARDRALEQDPKGSGPVAASTWFDVLTAAAFRCFTALAPRVWVVECGLGGRLDSTNVVPGQVAVLTTIELEHTAILGSTREAIAGEKAGIIKPGARVVAGLWGPDHPAGRGDVAPGLADPAARRIEQAARAVSAQVHWRPRTPGETFDDHNRGLAALALAALGQLGLRSPGGALAAAEWVHALPPEAGRLPGRWEQLWVGGVPVVLDGAHVATSLAALLEQLSQRPGLEGPPVVVLGMGRDKDATAMLKCLVGRVDSVLCSSAGAGPYLAPEALAEKARELGLATQTVADPRAAVQRALAAANGRWVLVTGSLHLVGAVRGGLIQAAHPGSPC